MRLTLDALETVDAIAAKGSFARAAETLHRVPSALTYTVRKLESDLGVTLFDRSGKRAVLTPTGRELLERGRELLRQAEALEYRMKQAAGGWEPELSIAVDEIIPLDRLFPLIQRFDALGAGTRLRFTQEIFGGSWDALIERRADLALAAPGDAPAGYGLHSREWLSGHFVFACAPGHALAGMEEPLPAEAVMRHRAVVVADSSRRLPGRSAGVQPGQAVMVVPTLAAKRAAQIAGLGVGYLPLHMAQEAAQAGQLLIRRTEIVREPAPLRIAWRNGDEGQALRWFREAVLADTSLSDLLAADVPAADVRRRTKARNARR